MKKIYKRGTLICTLLIMLMCFAGLYFENNRANATYSQLKSVPETTEGIAPRSSVTQGGEVLKINGTKRDLELKSITDFTDVKFIPNAYYFVSNPMHAKNKQEYNSNGTCTTIAVQMLIGYHNYYSDRRILPVAAENYKFLDTIYGKKDYSPAVNDTIATGQGKSSTGTLVGVYDALYAKTDSGGGLLGQSIGNVTRGANNFLDAYTPTEVRRGISLTYGNINLSEVRADIDNGIPVVIGMDLLGDLNFHVVVAYGYAKYDGTDGFIVHYGWGDAVTEGWVPANWFGFQIRMSVDHEHKMEDTSVDYKDVYRLVKCSECGYEKPDLFYNISNGMIDMVKYPLTKASIPEYIKVYDENIAGFVDEKITHIGHSAFSEQKNLASVTLPRSVKSVYAQAFANCENLSTLNCSGGLNSLGEKAFFNCKSLRYFPIQSTKISISDGAFAGCSNLNFGVSSLNTDYYCKDNVLYTFDQRTILATGLVPNELVIPTTVEKITDYAFFSNSNLKSVKIGEVREIGNYSFADCENLEKVYFYSYTAPELGSRVFAGNTFTVYVPYCELNAYYQELVHYTSNFASIPITVSLFSNGNKIDTLDTFYGANIQNLKTPFKKGYDFVGWFDGENNGNLYENGTLVNLTEDFNLYARYTPAVFYIQFSGYGSENLEDKSVVYDSPIGTLPVLSRRGYTFIGWKDKNNVYYTADTIWQSTSNVNLIADFQANGYVINYDGNGGTASIDVQNVTFGNTISQLATASRPGYTFVGWNTRADGTGETITAPFVYDADADMTLYAQYEKNIYTVTFDKQGGTGGTNGVDVAFDSPMPAATAPVRVGYTFGGYYLGTTGSGKQYYYADMSSANNWDQVHSVTLFAYWIANTYDVTFDKQGGSGGTDRIVATYSSAMPEAKAPTKVGYSFGGYYSGENATGVKYYDSNMYSTSVWNFAKNSTLYAYWTPKVCEVLFDKQGGIGGTDKVYATYLNSMPNAVAPTKEGYIFEGYYSESSGGGTRYYNANMTSATIWNITEDCTLYAYWRVRLFTIEFDKQGGSGGTDRVTVAYGYSMPTSGISAPTKTGYTFRGYYEEPDGKGEKYYDGPVLSSAHTWTKMVSATLYAYWEKNTYCITLNNGYLYYNEELSIGYGDKVVANDSARYVGNRVGYDFKGYYSGANGTGVKYFDFIIVKYNSDYCYELVSTNKTWNKPSDGNLYAYWTAISVDYEYPVTISNADEDLRYFKIRMTQGQDVTITAPTIDGYTFEKMCVNGSYYTDTSYVLKNVQLKRNLAYGLDGSQDSKPVYIWYPVGSRNDNAGGLFMVYQKNECIPSGTLITLADGRQVPVEQLKGTERLLVWNLRTGQFDSAPLLFIDYDSAKLYKVINLAFSDGTQVKVIAEHGFWNFDLNRYVYITKENAQNYVGHWFNKQTNDENGMTWTKVKLTEVLITEEFTAAWSPVTYGHLCIYVNGMLSMPGATSIFANIFEVNADTMQIDMEKYLQDIETYGLFTYEEFAELYDVSEEVFDAFNGQYLKVAIGKGIVDEERIGLLVEYYKNIMTKTK